MPSSRIVDRLSLPTFSLQPLDPIVRSVSEYPRGYKNRGMRGDQAYGSLVLYQTSAQLVMLYYMVSKKHLPGRIVPLGVPFPGRHALKCMSGLRKKQKSIWGQINKQVKNHLLVHRPNIPLRMLAFGFNQSKVHIRLIRQ